MIGSVEKLLGKRRQAIHFELSVDPIEMPHSIMIASFTAVTCQLLFDAYDKIVPFANFLVRFSETLAKEY
ncbi:MAG TPA: hypothetical protein DEP91_02835 [Sphingomonas bacterium]|uniref:Uncharacterized protein n=1 Tax=Sphingomonas bacterium TaxID=1895847 RepID=A0A3D0W980_9SPHN|nr:hypothetical protein [Sphingomonas bacterium]